MDIPFTKVDSSIHFSFNYREFLKQIHLFFAVVEKNPNLPLNSIRLLIVQMLAGVFHMHLRGLVHRDLKPGNTIVSMSGQLKLTGFYSVKVGRGHFSQAIIG